MLAAMDIEKVNLILIFVLIILSWKLKRLKKELNCNRKFYLRSEKMYKEYITEKWQFLTILIVPSVVDPHVSVELFIQRSEEFWANYLKLYLKKRTSKPCLCLFTYFYVIAPFWFIQASHPSREFFCCINFYAVESLDKEHSVLIIKYLLPSVQPRNCLLRPGSADQDVFRLFLPKSTVFSSRLQNRE